MARVRKTDKHAFPSWGVLGHQVVVSNTPALPCQVAGNEWKRLNRLNHDEFSHGIDRIVSAERISGGGVAAGRRGLKRLPSGGSYGRGGGMSGAVGEGDAVQRARGG